MDLTDVTRQRVPVFGLGEMNPDEIRAGALWGRAAALSPSLRERYRVLWQRLRAENAPFRVVKDLALVSAPITAFDDILIACAGAKWRKCARVVGEALTSAYVGELVLFGRLRRLVEEGKLEARGDLAETRSSEMRLTAKQKS